MKIEEIEEQAEHQACAHIGISSYKRNPDAYSLFKNGFRVGAKQGMEHQWHDVESHVLPKREISKKYMPKANEKVMLKYHFYNETEIHYSDGYYDKFDFEFHIPNNPTGRIICVIAWCELLEFKDKE